MKSDENLFEIDWNVLQFDGIVKFSLICNVHLQLLVVFLG